MKDINPNYGILPLLNALQVMRLDVVFTPTAHLEQKAWLGAAVRNRFLCACESVLMPDGSTLRETFDRCPLPTDHFLYKQYCNGFPKCFVWDVSQVRVRWNRFTMHPNDVYTFTLYLFGAAAQLVEEVKAGIGRMMDLGLGTPPVSLTLLEIDVHEPFRLEDFADMSTSQPSILNIATRTPMSLFKVRDTHAEGYQAKMNGIPSLYQIAKTSLFRLATLTTLYSDVIQAIVFSDDWTNLIEGMAGTATSAWLEGLALQRINLHSTPKQDRSNVYALSGYMGEMTYANVDSLLVPVIKMAGLIGIGHDVSFGLGFFETTNNINNK